jgi:multidrug resistance efflux pump
MRSTDSQLTCDKIDDEIAANEAAINTRRAEIDEAQSRRTYNALAGGLIGAATSEDGSAARVEIDAYSQRIAHLRGISRKIKC